MPQTRTRRTLFQVGIALTLALFMMGIFVAAGAFGANKGHRASLKGQRAKIHHLRYATTNTSTGSLTVGNTFTFPGTFCTTATLPTFTLTSFAGVKHHGKANKKAGKRVRRKVVHRGLTSFTTTFTTLPIFCTSSSTSTSTSTSTTTLEPAITVCQQIASVFTNPDGTTFEPAQPSPYCRSRGQ